MSKLIRPVFHRWQAVAPERSLMPALRHVSRLNVNFYPYSPRNHALSHFLDVINSRRQPREKKFELKMNLMPFGTHATIDVEYRNGDKMTLDAEKYNAQELFQILKLKREDMENHMDWLDTGILMTIEEEAVIGGDGSEKKKKGSTAKKGGKKK